MGPVHPRLNADAAPARQSRRAGIMLPFNRRTISDRRLLMWFTSRSHDRESSISGECRRAHGSLRQRLAFWPALAARTDRGLPSPAQGLRKPGARFPVLTAAVNLLWTVAAATAVIAQVVALMWAAPHAEAPAPDEPPGSGIVVRTEVTAVWIHLALRDLARHQGGQRVDGSAQEVQTYLERNGWRDPWFALTYRLHQVNGQSIEITQIRWLYEAANHLEELQAVLATAAGRPPKFGGSDWSHARVEVIPDRLQAVKSREAIIRLMTEVVVGTG
jgi:hypothetical protein